MQELKLDGSLVGQKVENAARPDWGVGTVTRVQPVHSGPTTAFRVTVQFAHGQKQMLSPPARLIAPRGEQTREQGWLDSIGRRTLDDQLRSIPAEYTDVLGTPAMRLKALVPLFAWEDSPQALEKWARKQTGVGDPLSLWSRDELGVAWTAFCAERDSVLKAVVARVLAGEGRAGLQAILSELEPQARAAIAAVLARPL